jgi:molybdopterin synthase catalytic subunit/molybdopterin synthase sulfur carrier subunit
MNIHVKCFAGCKDVVGRSEQTINVPEYTTAGDAFDHLINMYTGLERFRSSLMLAVNTEYANRDVVLKEGDVLACIPPVSGGMDVGD